MDNKRMRKLPRKDVKAENNQNLNKIKETEINLVSSIDDVKRINRDALKLLEIFPEEVWILISDKISDATDAENFCNSSLFLRDILFDKRVLFLFPKVWDILGIQYHESKILWDKINRRYHCYWSQDENQPRSPPPAGAQQTECEACGKSRYSRWFSEILNCRQVCQKWCDTIDKFYEALPNTCEGEMLIEKSASWLSNEIPIHYWGKPLKMRCLEKHFQNSHTANENGKCERNPFIGRRLIMKFSNIAEDFLDELLSLLQKYGEHIWFCKLIMTGEFETWISWYTLLRQVLERLPNLRTLTLEYPFAHQYAEAIISAVEHPGLNSKIIRLNPLPSFKHLELLRAEDIIVPVLNEIIFRNNFITRLEIIQKELPDIVYNLFSRSLPNLKRLEMGICTSEQLSSFENGKGLMPLEELDLKCMEDIEWKRIFTVLERKWGNTLEMLWLKLPGRRTDDWEYGPDGRITEEEEIILAESASHRLKLFRIRHLVLDIPQMTCLDFILPMKDSLETLEVMTEYFTVNRKMKHHLLVKYQQQQIQFVGWTDDMNASNIWIVFPNLKKIVLHNENKRVNNMETWTREDWEEEVKIKDGRMLCEDISAI